jgi:hypothetical protein
MVNKEAAAVFSINCLLVIGAVFDDFFFAMFYSIAGL